MSQVITREPIWVALFALLKGVTYVPLSGGAPIALTTYSRRLLHWVDVSLDAQPALFLAQGSETHETKSPGVGDYITLRGKVYVYLQVQEPDGVPGTVLNPILDQIQALFPSAKASNPMTNKQTLGGLVQHAIIKGDWLTAEGTLGSQEVAIIPIEMLVVQ